MSKKRIGIIGGSGFYSVDEIQIKRRIHVDTPFGDPSDEFDIAELHGREIVFLPRHGRGHRILPSAINCRANIWALKSLDVEWILSISAVGSMKKEIQPLDIVLIDQFIDRTRSRKDTFFGDGVAAHIVFAHPVCEELRKVVFEAGHETGEGSRLHWGGTYLNIEGPAFSTRAESNLYRSWGLDVIGMTNLTEAKLAREAEICYCTLAMVTDYDCWFEGHDHTVSVDVIMENLRRNIIAVKKIIHQAILNIPPERHCECASALANSIVTDPSMISREQSRRLDLLIGKYIQK
ncbi:MAG TPA: S-methyl-5'-thioadenosine phosphorylase [bacterium]|nr:S-methyl-5'-thioadenosine phosphorylase [bacterium]